MKLLPLPDGSLRMLLDNDEAAMLAQLVSQLIQLLQSHSGTALDPDPLFAGLEVGGSDSIPEDPALARLFPDAYEGDADSMQFRRVTEQGLLNRKLQDAIEITSALNLGSDLLDIEHPVEVEVTPATLPAWVRTVTALRLAIAARIGLDEPEDHDRLLADRETRGTVLVFDWLAAILESILAVVGRHSPAGASRHEDDDEDDDTSDREESDGGPGSGTP